MKSNIFITCNKFYFSVENTKKTKFSYYYHMNTFQTKMLIKSVQDTKKAVILGDFNSGFKFKEGQSSKQSGN